MATQWILWYGVLIEEERKERQALALDARGRAMGSGIGALASTDKLEEPASSAKDISDYDAASLKIKKNQ